MRRLAVLLFASLAASSPATAASGTEPTRYPPGARADQDLDSIRAAAATYPLYLANGTTRESKQRPLIAFGRVRIQPPDAAAAWVPGDLVDLARSQAAWDTIAQWASLDTHPWQAKTVPRLKLAAPSGDIVAVPDEKRLMLLWPWRSY